MAIELENRGHPALWRQSGSLLRPLVVSMLVVVASAANPPRAASAELLLNGSFEIGRHSGDPPVGWDNGPGIANDIGFGAGQYSFFENGYAQFGSSGFEMPPGMPNDFTGIIRPAGAGNFFAGRWGLQNGTGVRGSATQIVNLEQHSGLSYDFSAWIASHRDDDDPDYAIVSLQFFNRDNARGTSLGSIVFDGNNQTAIPGEHENLLFYRSMTASISRCFRTRDMRNTLRDKRLRHWNRRVHRESLTIKRAHSLWDR